MELLQKGYFTVINKLRSNVPIVHDVCSLLDLK